MSRRAGQQNTSHALFHLKTGKGRGAHLKQVFGNANTQSFSTGNIKLTGGGRVAQAFGTVRRCDNCGEHKIAVFDGGIGADRSGASGLKTAQKTTFGSDLKVGFKVLAI